MAIIVRNDGLIAVPTGSLGLCFRMTDGTALPTDITIEAMPAGGDPDDLLTFTGLEILSDDSTEWKYVELTPPVEFGVEYDVAVKFDGVIIHGETLEVPSPGAARGAVLRQRLYEVLLGLYRSGEIDAKPYGTGQLPGMVNDGYIKSEAGFVLEVGNYYITASSLTDYRTRESQVSLPLRLHVAMDDGDDIASGSAEMEAVIDALMAVDWGMNGFGMIQSQVTFEGEEAEINEDRTVAVVPATLSVAIRRKISR